MNEPPLTDEEILLIVRAMRESLERVISVMELMADNMALLRDNVRILNELVVKEKL